MTVAQRQEATLAVDQQWRNGFYVITGMTLAERNAIQAGLARLAPNRSAS